MKRWMKSKQIHQYILLDDNITWQTNKLQEIIRQHILEVILHKKPKKIQEIHEGEKWRVTSVEENNLDRKHPCLEVVIICLLEDLSLGRSSTVRGYGHNDAILHLLGWKETSCSQWNWGSTKSLADVAKGSNNCSDHVWVALPVAAIFMPKWSC